MGLQWKGFYSLRPLRTLIFVRLFTKGNYSKMGKIVSKINGGNPLLTKRNWSGITTHFFSCLAILNDNKLPSRVFHRNVKTYSSTLQEKIRPSPIPGSQFRVLSSVDDVKKILQNRLKISSLQFNLSVSSKWEGVAQALISCSRVRHNFYRDSLHPRV